MIVCFYVIIQSELEVKAGNGASVWKARLLRLFYDCLKKSDCFGWSELYAQVNQYALNQSELKSRNLQPMPSLGRRA